MTCLLAFEGALGCNPVQSSKAAEDGVQWFHGRFNERDFKDVYAGTHDKFKDVSSEGDFTELLDAVHRKLGKVVSSEKGGWRINSHNMTTYVALQYETKFQKGKGVESFTFIVKDKKAFLVSYNINSRELLVN